MCVIRVLMCDTSVDVTDRARRRSSPRVAQTSQRRTLTSLWPWADWTDESTTSTQPPCSVCTNSSSGWPTSPSTSLPPCPSPMATATPSPSPASPSCTTSQSLPVCENCSSSCACGALSTPAVCPSSRARALTLTASPSSLSSSPRCGWWAERAPPVASAMTTVCWTTVVCCRVKCGCRRLIRECLASLTTRRWSSVSSTRLRSRSARRRGKCRRVLYCRRWCLRDSLNVARSVTSSVSWHWEWTGQNRQRHVLGVAVCRSHTTARRRRRLSQPPWTCGTDSGHDTVSVAGTGSSTNVELMT